MNAYTTTPSATNDSALRRAFRAVLLELRRAIELTGASYKHGVLPPL
jgi:hypothetical protein